MKVISVDPGKGITKLAYADENGNIITKKIDTRITRLNSFNDTDIIGANNYKIEYGDTKAVIGSQGDTDATDSRSKLNDVHMLATLVAITEAIDPEEKELALVNNIPAATYKSTEAKTDYVDMYNNQYDIVVNNVPYSFEIKDVVFLPETVGATFRHPELCGRDKVLIVDIGKYNIGLAYLEDGVHKAMETLDYGGIQLENTVIGLLETKYDAGIGRDKILTYLLDGYIKVWGDKLEGSDDVIAEGKMQYLDGIALKALKKNIDMQSMDQIIFIGGTSLTLRASIETHPKYSKLGRVLDDADVVSCVGNLMYGENYFNGK